MSVNQSKNIKNNTAAEEKKYRSIRLTQAHREDIVSAVMQQWAKANPPPHLELSADLQLFTAVVKKYANPTKKLDSEFMQFSRVLAATQSIQDFLSQASQAVHERIELYKTSYWNISVVDREGNKRLIASPKVPADLATKLEIPFISVAGEKFAFWPSNSKYNGNAILIPQDSAEYREYRQNVEAASDWEKRQVAQKNEVTDYLAQFNTTNQIREAWPELVPYLPAHIADPERVIKLPALAVSRLNERLGLK